MASTSQILIGGNLQSHHHSIHHPVQHRLRPNDRCLLMCCYLILIDHHLALYTNCTLTTVPTSMIGSHPSSASSPHSWSTLLFVVILSLDRSHLYPHDRSHLHSYQHGRFKPSPTWFAVDPICTFTIMIVPICSLIIIANLIIMVDPNLYHLYPYPHDGYWSVVMLMSTRQEPVMRM